MKISENFKFKNSEKVASDWRLEQAGNTLLRNVGEKTPPAGPQQSVENIIFHTPQTFHSHKRIDPPHTLKVHTFYITHSTV